MLSEFLNGVLARTRNTGAQAPGRSCPSGELAVSEAHAIYQEATLQGKVFSLATAIAGVTVAAANIASASPLQPLVGLFNPLSSGYNLVIWDGRANWASGTPGAGGLVWVIGTAVVTAVGGNGALNNASFVLGSSIAKTFVNSAMTGSGTGSILRVFGGPTAGALIGGTTCTTVDEVRGSICIPPGSFCGLCPSTAGTSPIISASMSWEEVNI